MNRTEYQKNYYQQHKEKMINQTYASLKKLDETIDYICKCGKKIKYSSRYRHKESKKCIEFHIKHNII